MDAERGRHGGAEAVAGLGSLVDVGRVLVPDLVPGRAQALGEDRLGQEGRGGRAVAGLVARLAGDLLDQRGPQALVGVGELDLLGHRHPVLRDRGRAPALVEDGVAAARPEGGLDRAGELAGAGEQLLAGVVGEGELLGCHPLVSWDVRVAS